MDGINEFIDAFVEDIEMEEAAKWVLHDLERAIVTPPPEEVIEMCDEWLNNPVVVKEINRRNMMTSSIWKLPLRNRRRKRRANETFGRPKRKPRLFINKYQINIVIKK